jgi:hypothetical protein
VVESGAERSVHVEERKWETSPLCWAMHERVRTTPCGAVATGERPVRPVKRCLRLTSGPRLQFVISLIFKHMNLEIQNGDLPNVFRAMVWKKWNNFIVCPNFKFPQDLKLQILEQIQI